MKRIIIISALAVACLIVVGCKEEQCDWAAYNGSGANPCDEGEGSPCEDYPPEGVAISWNDYNTVGELRNFFVCHRETLKEHDGDTVMLAGWLYWGDNEGEWTPDYTVSHSIQQWAYLTDNADHSGGHHTISVSTENVGLQIDGDKDAFFNEKWCINGIIHSYNLGTGGCCSYEPVIEIIEVFTVNS